MAIRELKSPKITTLFSNFSRKCTSAKYIFLCNLHRENLPWKMIQRKSEVKQKSSWLWNKFVEPYLLNQPIIFFSAIFSLGLFFLLEHSLPAADDETLNNEQLEKKEITTKFSATPNRGTLQQKLQPFIVYHGRITCQICFVFIIW